MCKDFFEANLSSSAFFKVDFYLCLLADLSRVSFAVLPNKSAFGRRQQIVNFLRLQLDKV